MIGRNEDQRPFLRSSTGTQGNEGFRVEIKDDGKPNYTQVRINNGRRRRKAKAYARYFSFVFSIIAVWLLACYGATWGLAAMINSRHIRQYEKGTTDLDQKRVYNERTLYFRALSDMQALNDKYQIEAAIAEGRARAAADLKQKKQLQEIIESSVYRGVVRAIEELNANQSREKGDFRNLPVYVPGVGDVILTPGRNLGIITENAPPDPLFPQTLKIPAGPSTLIEPKEPQIFYLPGQNKRNLKDAN